jgi:hypothetical protein
MNEEGASGGSMPDASGNGGSPVLVENFTRFVWLGSLRPLGLTARPEIFDSHTVPMRSGPRKLWVPMDEDDRRSQSEFFLPWVQEYLLGTGSTEGLSPGQGCVARRWNPDVVSRYGQGLVAKIGREEVQFHIKECEAYLFGTGVAVLVFECSLAGVSDGAGAFRKPALADLVGFNYAMRYAGASQAPRFRRPRAEKRPAEAVKPEKAADPVVDALQSEEGANLPEMTELLLSALVSAGGRLEPANERTLKVQTFVRVGPPASLDDLAVPFYQLRRVVKASYPVAPEDLDIQKNGREVARTFENIAIGCSLEGMAVLLADNGHPFYGQFAERVRRAYFAHYLLALHQRAGLTLLAVEACRLPHLAQRDRGLMRESMRDVEDLRDRAIDFSLHHRFSQVSVLSMYASVYERLVDVLGIPHLLEEVQDDVSKLDRILRERREEEEETRDRRITRALALFFPANLLLSLFGANLPHYVSPDIYWTPFFWVPVGLYLVATVAIVWVIRWRRPRERVGGRSE